jgi:Flp pilus assembly protein TadD
LLPQEKRKNKIIPEMKKKVAEKKVIEKQILPAEPGYLKNYRPLLIIAVVCLVVYFPTLWYGFSPMDEQWVIFGNKDLMSHLHNLPEMFSRSTLGMYYRPVWTGSFIIDMVLGGGSAGIFHFTNILLHILCSILLYRFFLQLNFSKTVGFFFALIFAVHPINLHSVAWIPGRNDSLLCLFTLLSCIQLLNYFKTKKIIHLAVHLLAFVLALFSKENAIVLPFVYFLLWFVFQKEKNKKEIFTPLFSWFFIGIFWFFLRKHFIDYFPPLASGSFGNNLIHFISALLVYAGKIILPIEQSVMPVLKDTSLIPFLIVIAVLIGIAIRFGVKDKKIAWFGLIWFFIFILIPAWVGATNSNGEQYEHRIYTSLIGAFIFFSQLKIPIGEMNAKRIAIVLLLVFAAKTMYRSDVYTNELSFAEAGTIESPSVPLFYVMTGNLYESSQQFSKAITSFSKAIELNPSRAEYYNNRSSVYCELKDFQHALEDDNKVIELKKDQPESYANRSMVRFYLGDLRGARTDFMEAKKLGAKNISPQFEQDLNLALLNETIKRCTETLKQNPNDADAYNYRGLAFMQLNKYKEALDDFNKAVSLYPDENDFIKNRDAALARLAQQPMVNPK